MGSSSSAFRKRAGAGERRLRTPATPGLTHRSVPELHPASLERLISRSIIHGLPMRSSLENRSIRSVDVNQQRSKDKLDGK